MLPKQAQKQKEPAMVPASSASASASASTTPFPPDAIPPRRSSTGQHEKQQQQLANLSFLQSAARRHHHSSSSSSNMSSGAPLHPNPMLHAVPETDWLGSSSSSAATVTAAAAVATAQVTAAAHRSRKAKASANEDGSTSDASTSSTSSARPPAADAMRYAADDFDFGSQRTWTREKERVIRGPFAYLNSVRGKEFRTQLIDAFNGWLEVPPDSLAVITRIVGMLHTASLLVDDVEDSSSLRRGMPVAHNIFGVPQAINSANYMYFVALQQVQKLRSHARALAVFSEELVNLHRGQGMDLFWRDTLTCPSEDDYLEMVANKTGGLFRLGIKLMQAESPTSVDCVPLVNILGLIFQIQDDYRNLMAVEYAHNKGLCEDLSEGKFSFPVIHSIRSDPSDLQLIHILRLKTTDDDVKRYAVARMESTGSFAYTRDVLSVLTARARAIADALDEGQGRSRAVHAILDKLVIR